MNWVKFGWQGISMELPSDWEFGGLSGDYDNGYVRMDDEEMPRMELKWSKSKEKDPDLHKILDSYFKSMKKRLGGTAEGLKIKRDTNLIKDEEFSEGRKVLFYNWKSNVRANGAIWHCKECKRIIVVQIMGRLKETLLPLTNRIFESIKDHPDGHTNFWSAYQLMVEVPRRYQLEKRKLMSGYLMLGFIDGSRSLDIERYGLADVTLRDTDLETWFRGYYAKVLKKYGFSFEEIEDEDDHRIQMLGQEKRFIDNIPLSPVFAIDKLLRRKQIAAQFWHCKKSNRIFVIMAVAKKNAGELTAQVASSIKCHGEDEEISEEAILEGQNIGQ
ncbi:hypothetical protein GF312_18175 [Candidatus Poribacteria bacterium]|nr:hypothetical protein [Candidatus Poribacteria bacterium]